MRINEILNEDLRKWFKEKWVRFGPDGKIRGDCARGSDSEGKPKCLPQSKAHSLGKKGRASAAARKRREDPNPERKGKAKNVATKKKTNEGVAEGLEQQYLWHGSRQKIPMLEPRQAVDIGGAAGSNQNAIYATSDPIFATQMGMPAAGSDYGHFPNDPQMVLFSGKIRKGKNVYLHKLPFYGPDGKPQFVQGAHDREFYSIPGVKGIKPVEIKAVPVNCYLNLVRQATPQDLELRKELTKEGVAEGFPQPGESSGKAKQFNPNAKIQTKEMTLDQILSSIKGIPYVNDVVDDWDAKDYSWGVTKKVIEYAQYLQKNPQSVANLPPLVVIDGQLNDGAHRLSAINLLQKRMDPKNPLWKQVKLKVNFGTSADVASEQGVAEEQVDELKCWTGYTRVRGVPAGAPGSCKKKTNEGESKKKFSLSDLDYYLQHPEQMSDDEFEREFGMTRAQAEQQFGGSMPHDDEYDMTDDQVDELLGISNNSNKRWTEYGDPIHESCPHCGGELVSEEDIMEKKDACYYKVKSRYKVWPSAYASGALVQCRKKGAKNWGTKK